MRIFARVELITNDSGIVQAVRIDGVLLSHIASARIELEPMQLTKLVLTLLVEEVVTIPQGAGD